MLVASSISPISARLSMSQNVHGRNAPSPGRKAVVRLVALVAHHEAVAHQLRLDRGDGAAHTDVAGRQEVDERDHQQARVELRAAVCLHERVSIRVEAVGADVVVDLLAHLAPFLQRSLTAELLDRAYRAIERHPRHYLRMSEVLARPAHLPQAFVGLAPVIDHELHQVALKRPRVGVRTPFQ